MATAEESRTGAATLYDQAIAELDAGDLRQASEKLWGAAAQALKAVAERRGWRHGSHANFYSIMAELEESGSTQNLQLHFAAASELHTNFYENWLTESQIRRRSDYVRLLIEELNDID